MTRMVLRNVLAFVVELACAVVVAFVAPVVLVLIPSPVVTVATGAAGTAEDGITLAVAIYWELMMCLESKSSLRTLTDSETTAALTVDELLFDVVLGRAVLVFAAEVEDLTELVTALDDEEVVFAAAAEVDDGLTVVEDLPVVEDLILLVVATADVGGNHEFHKSLNQSLLYS